MRQLLYSTNVYLKLLIQEKYFNDKHYIWCSEYFDSNTAPKYSIGTLIAPSSNPASIYKELQRDVMGKDKHSAKINAQKASFVARAIESFDRGDITEDEKEEIIYMVNDAPFEYWRPLLYVASTELIKHKLTLVPINQRAGFGNEYIAKDLTRYEFDIVEL
jgi:hypothetical protein